MPADSFVPAASPGIRTRGRSLLSRFASPLASRNRNISDFHIEPDDPWRSYGPGDIVGGCVVLTVVKPVRITHLVVCLHGQARVFKTQVAPGDGHADAGFLGPGRGRRGAEYLGDGNLSLFEDESVLCGDGRLQEGVYRFKFELVFPTKGLPSSIDFERGVVSYYITSTLTRPTTIAPTMTCQRRIQFQDLIDVAPLSLPKPKVISLEPISKRSRMKSKVVNGTIEASRRKRGTSLPRSNTEQSDGTNTTQPDIMPPQSPAPSEESGASVATESSRSYRIIQQQPSPSTEGNSNRLSNPKSSSSSISESLITATAEILRPGGLPGDMIPIKVSVKHTKAVRGTVIVTLYRQGRIDMHPPLPIGPQSREGIPEYEDVYPKSKTGLGGLHFSSGSPSSVFRKDLFQSTAPLIINPHTLTAETKASVRLPEDAFPTINNVPGAMITFKYYVEVVIDLCGKLGESRLLPRLSLTTNSNTFASENGYDQRHHVTSSWADRIVDTDSIRRIKTVVSCLFDVTVGSRDSARTSKKWAEEAEDTGYDHLDGEDGQNGWQYDQWSEDDYAAYYGGHYADAGYWYDGTDGNENPPQLVPPPELEEPADEKSQLRRAEELLLPSQPPQGNGQGPSSFHVDSPNVSATAPTAPYIAEEEVVNADYEDAAFSLPLPSAVSARSIDTVVPRRHNSNDRLPISESDPEVTVQEDKQELERQRLLTQASGPPQLDGEQRGEPSVAGSQAPDAGVPSAPLLTEEDEYQTLDGTLHDSHGQGEHLPRYQR